MNLLEDWLKNLIEKPIEVLNSQYTNGHKTKEELAPLYLPLIDQYSLNKTRTEEASHVSEVTLQQLHKKIRDCACEEAIWFTVLWYLSHPLPMPIAHDLIDRGVAILQMALTRQVDEVQWRLATFSEDALYTLIRERYVEPRYSITQFEMMLELYTFYRDGVLYMLSYYETSSPEKEAVFLAAVEREKERVSEHIRERLDEFLDERLQESADMKLEDDG